MTQPLTFALADCLPIVPSGPRGGVDRVGVTEKPASHALGSARTQPRLTAALPWPVRRSVVADTLAALKILADPHRDLARQTEAVNNRIDPLVTAVNLGSG